MHPEIKKATLEAPRAATNNILKINNFTLENLPKALVVINISEKVLVRSATEELISKIKEANTFDNPKYESNQKHGYSNWQTPRTIETFNLCDDGSISLPRGFLPDLLKLCKECNVHPVIEDLRCVYPSSFPSLKGISLRPYQEHAISQAMQFDQGAVISPTGSGKSLMGLEIIKRRGQRALIIVHRSELAKQWADVIEERMGIKAGLLGDGEWSVGDQITIAMVQTLAARENDTKALSNAFGLILVDEGHHLPASTFFDVIGLLAAKYRYMLSATPNRRDGLETMIYRAIGPAIALITKQEVENLGSTVPATVIPIQTGFNPGLVNSWNQYLDSLTTCISRNLQIIDLAQASKESTLILVDRVAHAEQLSEMLNRRGLEHVLAHGKIGKEDRDQVMERMKSAKLTIGTTSMLGEGIDISSWSVLVMASPISSEIKLMQAIGRIVRPAPGKARAIVYDLKDDCGFSGASFKKRFEIYKKHKIWVQFQK